MYFEARKLGLGKLFPWLLVWRDNQFVMCYLKPHWFPAPIYIPLWRVQRTLPNYSHFWGKAKIYCGNIYNFLGFLRTGQSGHFAPRGVKREAGLSKNQLDLSPWKKHRLCQLGTVIVYSLLSVHHENCLLYAAFFVFCWSKIFFYGQGWHSAQKMSNVLRSFGSNNIKSLQHKKLRIQKTWGTEDKLYPIDTILPALRYTDIMSRGKCFLVVLKLGKQVYMVQFWL